MLTCLAALAVSAPTAGANDSGPTGPAAQTPPATETAVTAAGATATPPGLDPAADAVDCQTGAPATAADPGADLAGFAAGTTAEGDLLLSLLTWGDPAGLMARGIFSLAYEFSLTLPGDGRQISVFDQLHDTRREAQVVDDQGRVVAGTEVAVTYGTVTDKSETTREITLYDSTGRVVGSTEVLAESLPDGTGGVVEMRVHTSEVRYEDITVLPVSATSYWMIGENDVRACDRIDRVDAPVVALDATSEVTALIGVWDLTAATDAAPTSTTTPTRAPATTAASSASATTGALATPLITGAPLDPRSDDGNEFPPLIVWLLSVLAAMGLLGLFWWWWQHRGHEARAADSLERLFGEGAADPPDSGAPGSGTAGPGAGSGAAGGGISDSGTTTVTGSTFSGNSSPPGRADPPDADDK